MFIICFCLSLIVSGLITILMIRFKKNDPFPRGSILWMLLWGAWIAILIGSFLLAIDEITAFINTGTSPLIASFNGEEGLDEVTAPENITLFYLFREAFLTAAIPEEIGKFIVASYFIFKKKLAANRPVFNSAICCGLVALGFEIMEDMIYTSGDIFTAVLRGTIPLHFCMDVIMGYFIGKVIVTGKRSMYLPALLIPIMVHGIYDALIFALDLSDWILLPFFILYFFLLALTAAELGVLREESKRTLKTLDDIAFM